MRVIGYATTTKVFGAPSSTNEDCVAPSFEVGAIVRRFVMCDGATTGFAGGAWARCLASAIFDECDLERGWSRLLVTARNVYNEMFHPEQMNIFKQQNFAKGSSSTALIVEPERDDPFSVKVSAIGDTCCFAVSRQGKILDSFPNAEVGDFDRDPYLVTCTDEGIACLLDPKYDDLFWKRTTLDFHGHEDAYLVCATDAVSRWLTKAKASGRNDWVLGMLNYALEKKKRHDFPRFVESQRERGHMVVDDSTIAVLRLG